MPFQALDGPATQGQQNVTDASVFEVKAGGSALDGRNIVTIMPLDGKIWVYFGDDSVAAPNAATVKSDGFPHFKNSLRSYEAGELQPIYIVSDTGTVDVRFAERA